MTIEGADLGGLFLVDFPLALDPVDFDLEEPDFDFVDLAIILFTKVILLHMCKEFFCIYLPKPMMLKIGLQNFE
jgi:hypothetical protein